MVGGRLVGMVKTNSAHEGEKVTRTGQAHGRTEPIHDVEPSRGETPLNYGIADRSQPNADGVGNPLTAKRLADFFYSDGLIAIHVSWIAQYF